MRIAPALILVALASTALAQDDAPRKRDEGRYFVELSEIMLTPSGFDRIMADVDEDGADGPLAPYTEIAEIDRAWLEAPRFTFGLNRPSRKTTLYVSTFDIDTKAERIPNTIEKPGQVVTTPWLPPGITFQRQRPGQYSPQGLDDDYIPNWGEEYGYIRRFEFKTTLFAAQHNIFENKQFRLRWIAGVRHASTLQKTTLRVAYAPEGVIGGFEVQDFLSVQSSIETHGIGPNVGLAFRELLGKKKKKWSIEGQVEVAAIPESTTAKYGLSLEDTSGELDCETTGDPNDPFDPLIINCTLHREHPAMPQLGVPNAENPPFNAFLSQQDFTELTWLAQAELGIRFQPTDAFTIGLSWWGMTWTNLLSEAGMVDTIHREGTYEQYRPSSTTTDPALRDNESVIHVPRFSKREDIEMDGISLTMRFEF